MNDILSNDVLTISNLILSFFVFIHLCCEFFHYIYSFFSDRKRKRQLESILEKLENKCLKDCKKGKCSKDKEEVVDGTE